MSEMILESGRKAKAAAARLALASSEEKNRALLAMADALAAGSSSILKANLKDYEQAAQDGATTAFLDRLKLTPARILDMAQGLRDLVALTDPIGEVIGGWRGAAALEITQVRVPLGVVGIIYEARPNVTADAAGICLKTGNAVLLRGSSDAWRSNRVIVDLMCDAVAASGLPAAAIQLLDDTSREGAAFLMKMNRYVDVLIPRGGAGLIKTVVDQATVPVIETGSGNCHIYVDESANLNKAVPLIENAKLQRPSTCNAVETVLVHEAVAGELLPRLGQVLSEQGVTLRGCLKTCALLPQAEAATEVDYATEYGDLILALRVVPDLETALAHIDQYGTHHSDAILTENFSRAEQFIAAVDSAAVYVNASTRFTDGGQFGFGAEMGISTQKLHARGPMGLSAMTSTKFVVRGHGQIRA